MDSAQRVHWIDDERAFTAMCGRLREADVVAVDTEQDSFFSHRAKVCLIQIGALETEWIVDPLALRDLSELRDVFEDERIVKVLHAADNDIGLLRRDFGLTIRGLFDTMVAASILGRKRTGLAPLLDELFGIRLAKEMQRSDWRRRPLQRQQIEYAALDVRHLARLREVLAAELEAADRVEESRSEFERAEAFELVDRPFDPDSYWRIEGARSLDPVERRVLRDLFLAREEIAAAEDRARFRVAGDAVLVAIARRKPRSLGELARVGGVNDRLVREHGKEWIETVARALDEGPLAPPPRKPPDRDVRGRMDDETKRVFDVLRAWRAQKAHERGVEAGRVAPNALLLRIVDADPKSADELARAGFEPWRIREYGEGILAALEVARNGGANSR